MSIKPKCNICKKELVEFGAILLSPPKKDIVRKFHICVVCYEKLKLSISSKHKI
jgi:hypothetical protein